MSDRSSERSSDRVVVGSGLAALVAADALAGAGQPVRLLVEQRSPGGGFGSLHRQGRVLERGMRLLDLPSERAGRAPLESYRPGPDGHCRYLATIREFLNGLVGERLVRVQPPQMFVAGRSVNDLYSTADVAALRAAIGPADASAIRAEALACWRGMGDPDGLLAADTVRRLDRMTLGDASYVNHGRTFHRLFMEPVAQKFMSGGCTEVIAALRARVGLPLFTPQALCEAAGGEQRRTAADHPFYTVTGGGAGEVVTALLERLARHSVIPEPVGALERVESLDDGTTRLGLAGGQVIDARYPVLGVPAGQLFRAVGSRYTPDMSRTVLSWIEVADTDLLDRPSSLTVVDADIPALRISSTGLGAPGRTVLTVELRHDTAAADVTSAARAALERTALLRAGAEMVELHNLTVSSLPLPTHANAERFARAAAVVADANLDAEIVGAGLHFGADSMFEQIVQGLRAAEALGR